MIYIVPVQMTLLEALEFLSPDSSKTTRRSWLKQGRVSVDGRVEKVGNTLVFAGQKVKVGPRIVVLKEGLHILYEDRDLVVIEKPEGLLSVATDFETDKTAHAILKKYYRPKRVHVVHRLDQATSGVMLFALSSKARDRLKETFEHHEIERGYYALVEGRFSTKRGIWESYLFEDNQYVVHSTQDPKKGKKAVTHYEVMAASRKSTSLQLRLETGRKNQIRVHCKEAGHPIVGDKKYGAMSDPFGKLCLCAYLLAFFHPVTKTWMRYELSPPNFITQGE